MIVFWITLLCLHQGYTLVPVKTVHLGEAVTFTCATKDLNSNEVRWYKQSAGDNLKLIVSLWRFGTPDYRPEFPESNYDAHYDGDLSKLTILRASPEDEGMYHCAFTDRVMVKWSGTYLLVKGHSQRASNYSVVQRQTASGPGDSETLQCSVLSDSQNKSCSGDLSMFWFRSHNSHPDIIYTDGHRQDECEETSDSQRRCVYHFSKAISSSDSGTYYCAVAACGQILFGHENKPENVPNSGSSFIVITVLAVCLAVSAVGNVALICSRKMGQQCKGKRGALSEARYDTSLQPAHDPTDNEESLNYTALSFSERKPTRGRKKREFGEDSVYSQVVCSQGQ